MSHGAGGRFINGRNIKQLHNCAVSTIVMGCDSTKKMFLIRLHVSCPAFVGNLWAVYEKTREETLKQYFKMRFDTRKINDNNVSLGLDEAILLARKKCKLKDLIGWHLLFMVSLAATIKNS
nr:11573_t:CDS:2 [Entrophospora candida]